MRAHSYRVVLQPFTYGPATFEFCISHNNFTKAVMFAQSVLANGIGVNYVVSAQYLGEVEVLREKIVDISDWVV